MDAAAASALTRKDLTPIDVRMIPSGDYNNTATSEGVVSAPTKGYAADKKKSQKNAASGTTTMRTSTSKEGPLYFLHPDSDLIILMDSQNGKTSLQHHVDSSRPQMLVKGERCSDYIV